MSERPPILQLGPDPEMRGGMPASIKGLLASPLADRHRLEMVVTYRGARPLGRILTFCGALARLLTWSAGRRGRVVHIHATVRGSAYRKAVCVLVAKALRRRVVLQIHSGPGDIATFRAGCGRLSLVLLGSALRSADVLVAVSASSVEALGEAGVAGPIEVVPNAPPPLPELDAQGPPAEIATIAYLGGFANSAKGGDVLLDALARIPAGAPLRVTLAGPGQPPPALARIENVEVEWAGWLEPDAKDRLMRGSDAVVIPSRSEGLPMALLEAMAYRLAVVATDVGGIGDTLGGEDAGLLVPAERPEALAEAMLALAEDPARRRSMGDRARARVEELDEVDVAGRLADLYERVA